MKTNGEFSSHSYHIDASTTTEPVRLVPFGDLHFGAPLHCKNTFKRFIDFCKKSLDHQPTMFYGMGDYVEVSSTSERRILNSGLHDSTLEVIDNQQLDTILELAHKLNFMKGHTIGVLNGNHFHEFKSGIHAGKCSDHILADQLETKYLGVMNVTHVSVNLNGNKKTFDICAHHGKGGGKRIGATLNAVEDLRNVADADIYLMGHTHGKAVGAGAIHRWNSSAKCLETRDVVYARTGSFLLGHRNDKKSYIADMGLGPASLGWVSIDASISRRTTPEGKSRMQLDLRGSM